MIREKDVTKIGRLAKPHGVKGEISLLTEYDFAHFTDDMYIICDMEGILVPFFIESLRPKGAASIILKLEDINSEDKVKILSGRDVYIPKEMAPKTDDDFKTDALTGFAVIDEAKGLIGTVSDIDSSTRNVLLKIYRKENGKELLLPLDLAKDISPDKGEIIVSLPEGILEL